MSRKARSIECGLVVWECAHACSHSQTPLSLRTIEAAVAEPVSVALTSGLGPKNYPTDTPTLPG